MQEHMIAVELTYIHKHFWKNVTFEHFNLFMTLKNTLLLLHKCIKHFINLQPNRGNRAEVIKNILTFDSHT